jgi:CRISPR-associated protein Cmr1
VTHSKQPPEFPGRFNLSALKALHAEEARLFGAAANDGAGGQGVFLLWTADQTQATNINAPNFSALSYMLGMGLHANGQTTRSAIKGEFAVSLRFRSSATDDDKRSVLGALRIFGLLGSLGSRARHGWGSVALTGIEGGTLPVPQVPPSNEIYEQELRALLVGAHAGEPPYSAFSARTEIAFTRNLKDSGMAVIEAIGTEMGVYRSWGRNGKVFSTHDAEGNFKPDHDNMRDAANGNQPAEAPKRLVFGLPHNYFFSGGGGGKVDIQITTGGRERRASPLFFHVHPVLDRKQQDKYIGVLFLLGSRFLPATDEIKIKQVVNGPGGKVWDLPAAPDWTVISRFLKRV